MKIKSNAKLTKIVRSVLRASIAAGLSSFVLINTSHAVTFLPNSYGEGIGLMCCPHWYVEGNIGVSHDFDKPFRNTTNYVEHSGTGWNVNSGYQFFHIYGATFGGELGYTHYADSREYTRPPFPTLVGRTEHETVEFAGTGQLPLFCNVSALAKLGVAYLYARKNAYPVNFSASATDYNVYYGFGLMYNVTKAAAIVGQWNRAHGDNRTGTQDLYSLGVRVNLA